MKAEFRHSSKALRQGRTPWARRLTTALVAAHPARTYWKLVLTGVLLLGAVIVLPLVTLTLASPAGLAAWHPVTLGLWLLACGGALALTVVAAALVQDLCGQLRQAQLDLELSSVQDLTLQTYKKQYFLTLADAEWTRCRRYGIDAALLVLHGDQLASVLAQKGSQCRDALMREITLAACGSLRKADLVGRFAADQIAIFVPHTDHLGALDVAERIRNQVEKISLKWEADESVRSLLSIGVASLGPNHTHLEGMIGDAVKALAQAQREGGNCVRAAPLQTRRPTSRSTPPDTSARFKTQPPRRR